MFKLLQPSMALNAADITWSKIRMQITKESVSVSLTREQIIQDVVTAANGVSGGKLKNVVINCHGLPGYVGIGQGFNSSHLGLFTAWAGKVEKIWFVACLVARIPTAQMQTQLNTTYPGAGAGDGNVFCSQLARNAHCYVVAPTERQVNQGGYVIGQMPSYEGLVLSYNRQGIVSWSHRYTSTWIVSENLGVNPSGE